MNGMRAKTILYLSIFVMIFTGLPHCRSCLINAFAFYPERVPANEPPVAIPGVQELFIVAADGTRLHAFYLSYPDSKKVLLFLHGNAGNAYHRLSTALSLRRKRMNVLLIDYRGYGKSEGSPSEAGVYADGEAAMRYLIEERKFSNRDIYVLGRSIGSTAATFIAEREQIGGLILISPLSSGREMARKMGLGWFSRAVGDAFDNAGRASHIRIPTLILHGDRDQIVPISQGRQVFEALASRDKTFLTIKGAGHNNVAQVAGALFANRISEFVFRHTGR